MLCASVWGFFYGLELSVSTKEAMLFFIKLEYLGIASIGAFWLIFSLKYTAYKSKNFGLLIALILLVPAVTYLFVLTNESHHLHYKSLNVINSGPFPTVKIEPGPWYYINFIYIYFAYGMGSLLIWKRFRSSDRLFKTQTKLLLSAGVFPLIFNFFYQTHIFRVLEVIDLTPFAFLLSYLIIGFAILKYQLF